MPLCQKPSTLWYEKQAVSENWKLIDQFIKCSALFWYILFNLCSVEVHMSIILHYIFQIDHLFHCLLAVLHHIIIGYDIIECHESLFLHIAIWIPEIYIIVKVVWYVFLFTLRIFWNLVQSVRDSVEVVCHRGTLHLAQVKMRNYF